MSVSDLSRVVDSVSDFKTRKQRLSCWSRTVNYYIAKNPKPKTQKTRTESPPALCLRNRQTNKSFQVIQQKNI